MENKVGDKKWVVNMKIQKIVRIKVAHVNLIDGKDKAELEKAVKESSKLLEVLTETNRRLSCKVKATTEIGN